MRGELLKNPTAIINITSITSSRRQYIAVFFFKLSIIGTIWSTKAKENQGNQGKSMKPQVQLALDLRLIGPQNIF